MTGLDVSKSSTFPQVSPDKLQRPHHVPQLCRALYQRRAQHWQDTELEPSCFQVTTPEPTHIWGVASLEIPTGVLRDYALGHISSAAVDINPFRSIFRGIIRTRMMLKDYGLHSINGHLPKACNVPSTVLCPGNAVEKM